MYLYVDQPLEKSLCQKKLEMIFPFLYPQAIFWASHSSDARLCAELGMSGSAQHCHRPQLQQGAQEFSSALTAQVPEQLSAQLRAPQPFQPGFLRQQSARLLNKPPLSLLFQFPPWWAISAKPKKEQRPRRQSPRGNKGYRKGVHTNRHLGAHVGTGHRSSQGTEKPLIVTHCAYFTPQKPRQGSKPRGTRFPQRRCSQNYFKRAVHLFIYYALPLSRPK